MPARVVSTILGLLGGAAGGWLGYLGFVWMAQQGYYALVLPGGLVGLGCGLLARHPSWIRGVVCGVAGLALGLFCEWKVFPFIADSSFRYLVLHIMETSAPTKLMLGVGTFLAFWMGKDSGYAIPGRKAAPARPSNLE